MPHGSTSRRRDIALQAVPPFDEKPTHPPALVVLVPDPRSEVSEWEHGLNR